jgi:hypothetical protein
VRRRLAALAAGFLIAGCASSTGPDRPWIYALSRDAYGGDDTVTYPSSETGPSGDDWVLVTALLPFVVDTLLLPVTVTHDFVFME